MSPRFGSSEPSAPEGLCGGAVIGLETLGSPPQDVHVPLAHQSALAGVLLAAAFVRHELDGPVATTRVTSVDVLRKLGVHLSRPLAWHDPRCICRDSAYVTAFRNKWPQFLDPPGGRPETDPPSLDPSRTSGLSDNGREG